jgi:phosphoadenosine phosphosulfate reductase
MDPIISFLFKRYYEEKYRPWRPKYSKFHHYRKQLFNGYWKKADKKISSNNELTEFILKKYPAKNIYYSISKWLNPEKIGSKNKYNKCLGTKLVFDFDIIEDLLDINQFEKGKRIVIDFKNYLKESFGFNKFSYLWTGNKGFHLTVLDYDYLKFYDNFIKNSSKKDMKKDIIEKIETKNRDFLIKKISERGFRVDLGVISDIMRIVRLPKTLHGSTGLKSILKHNEKDFMNLKINESFEIPDNYDLKLFFIKDLPELNISRLPLGPFEKGTITNVSSDLGAFLILQNYAKLVSLPNDINKKDLKPFIWLENKVRWCKECNIPILEKKECPICKSSTFMIGLYGDEDARPAFKINIRRIRQILNDKYGSDTGNYLIPDDKVILLNRIPRIKNRQLEIIVDGYVIGKIKYDLNKLNFTFVPTIEGAYRLNKYGVGKWIKVKNETNLSIFKFISSNDIIDSNLNNYNLNDLTFIIQDNDFRGIGRIIKRLENEKRRKNIQILSVRRTKENKINRGGQNWDQVVKANTDTIKKYENESILFIRSIKNFYGDLEVSVPFSGGKDSLVVVKLTEKALQNFIINYVKSEIEFPETNEYVGECIEKLGLRDNFIQINENRSLEKLSDLLGPPQIDNNWCVNVYKLGPTNQLYRKHYPRGCLSLVGLRSYESNTRVLYYRLNLNPWFPSNILNVHPIYDWNALLIWLYIFQNDLPINPIYEKYGRERCGCWICPHQGLSNLHLLQNDHKDLWRLLQDILKTHQKKIDAPEQWITYGLWRWRNLPTKIKKWAEDKKVSMDYLNLDDIREVDILNIQDKKKLENNLYTIKGQIINLKHFHGLKNILNVLGKVEEDNQDKSIKISHGNSYITIDNSGYFIITAKSEELANKLIKNLKSLIKYQNLN